MSYSIPLIDSQTQALLKIELAEASKQPKLWPYLHQSPSELLPRFARYQASLAQLPRRTRRGLQRQWKRSLSALALLLALGQAPSALAATIFVNGTSCTLINAINSANTDSAIGGCRAGSGADVLQLRKNSIHTLTQVNNVAYTKYSVPTGNNGLPAVTSAITIEGHGSSIRRAINAPAFRIFFVSLDGNLTLNDTKISGGLTGSGNDYGSLGGGLFNYSGNVTLNRCTISGNTAGTGGGIAQRGPTYFDLTFDHPGRLTVINSTISGNNSVSSYKPAGVRNIVGFLTLKNSTISGNTGSGLTNCDDVYQAVAYVENSTISDNTGSGVENCFGYMTITSSTIVGNGFDPNSSGTGLDNDDSGIMTISRTLISGNGRALGPGREIVNFGPFQSNGFNLFGHSGENNYSAFVYVTPSPTDITATSDGTRPTPLAKILNPTLTRSGGPTQTHNLVLGSPAVDAVTTNCPPPSTDQRGVPRPQGRACDIGAVELVLCRGRAATLVGTAANDLLRGSPRPDVIHGLGGNDRIYGFGSNDALCGGGGNDQLFGGSGNDLFDGGRGSDLCNGDSGIDSAANCERLVNLP